MTLIKITEKSKMANRNVNPDDPFKEIEPFIRDLKNFVNNQYRHCKYMTIIETNVFNLFIIHSSVDGQRQIEVYLSAFMLFIRDFKLKHEIPDIDTIIARVERRQALQDDTCSDFGNVLSSEFEEDTMEWFMSWSNKDWNHTRTHMSKSLAMIHCLKVAVV